MSLRDAHIYIDHRVVATTTYDSEADRLFSDVAYKKSRGRIRARAVDCDHTNRQRAFAYVEWFEEHWPIEFCDDCLTILQGREMNAEESATTSWERTEEDAARDLAVRRWNSEWPRAGKPTRKRPVPSTVWPTGDA
jgi:hypothetical protein